MDYQSSMSGLQQIFDALLGQQMNTAPVEVDEMRQGQQQIADSMAEMTAMGRGQPMMSGIDAMLTAKRAAGVKEKDLYAGVYDPAMGRTGD